MVTKGLKECAEQLGKADKKKKYARVTEQPGAVPADV